jgi:hypothetical protein
VVFVAWGYIEGPIVLLNLLAVVVPSLFLAALVGLSVLWRSRLRKLGWIGVGLAVYAWGWSVVRAVVGVDAVWVYFIRRGWPHYLADWLLFMLTALTLVGIATVRSGSSRGIGTLMLATGVFGWVYELTDAGGVLEAESVHLGFGLLFSLGWVVLGMWLLVTKTRRAHSPRAGD